MKNIVNFNEKKEEIMNQVEKENEENINSLNLFIRLIQYAQTLGIFMESSNNKGYFFAKKDEKFYELGIDNTNSSFYKKEINYPAGKRIIDWDSFSLFCKNTEENIETNQKSHK